MKKIILLAIIFYYSINLIHSQDKTNCYVVYQNIEDKSWIYPHWFEKDKVTFTTDVGYFSLPEIFVKSVDGNYIVTNDTIKYKKEYQAQLAELNRIQQSHSKPISSIAYNSRILMRHNFFNKIKYLVVDTIKEMNSWKITQDTATILGFRCQKASILYNGRKMFAYFTTNLGYAAGPLTYRGLPGLILMVTNETGTEGYAAVEIVENYKGKIPKLEIDGKVMSQTEYQLLVDKANAEVFKNSGNLINSLPKKDN